MKTVWQTIAVAFSMFSAIPTPQFEWNEKNMKYMMVAFPLIGVLIGALCWGSYELILTHANYDFSAVTFGVLMTAIPILVTGGVHLDGYADTSDALASHKTMEEKLEIMKDPHVGSFAVIRVGLYLLLLTGFWAGIPDYDFAVLPLAIGFVLSRTLSGLAIASFPMAKNTGLAHTFASGADKKTTRNLLIALDVCVSLLLLAYSIFDDTPEGVAVVVAAHGTFGYYYYLSKKYFGGITGDLAGWFLQKCELFMVIAVFLVQQF